MSWSKWGIYSKKLTVCVLVLALILSSGFNSFTVYADNAANGQGKGFSDIEGHWAKEQIEDWSGKGLVSGYDDGTFKPERGVTRAETVALLSKAVGTLYNAQGVYGPEEGKQTIAGNVTVSVSGVTLKNLVIEGDLFLTAGIGDGDFEADGVVVKGRTVVSGGGEESVVFNNTSLEEVIVYVVDGKVRIVAKGDTDIGKVVLESGAHLQEEGLTGDGFGDVQVLVLKPGESIELEGDFDRVEIETAVEVSITGDTRIGELEVSEGAKGTKIDTGKDTVIENLTLNAGTDVTGQGTIKTANVNTDDYSFEKEPEKKVVDGEEVKEEKKTSGGGGGGGGGKEVPVSAISVEGVAKVGETLTAKVTPSGATVNYQWMRADNGETWDDIADATNKTYELVADDVGNYIKVKATGTGNYKGTVESEPVGPVEAAEEAPVVEVTRKAAPTQDPGNTGGDLEYNFADADGTLTISGTIADIPESTNPAGVTAKWIGVNIPKPTTDVADAGTIHLTIKEEGKEPVVHESVSYGEGDPFLYYFGAQAGGRSITLEIVWNGKHKETLVIEYVDTTEPEPEVKGSIARDPGNTGGKDLTVTVDGETITFDGNIEWYPVDESVGRNEAGNRVGVEITAPEGFDASGAVVTIGDDTYENLFTAEKNYFWWYPLVTEAGETFTATVEWNSASTQVFTVKIADTATLEKAPVADEALAAVNNYLTPERYVYADAPEALEEHLAVLGLDVGEDSDYAALDKTATGGKNRKAAVFYDLNNNKPAEGYDLATLTDYFNDMVATRLVTEESMDLVNNAENTEALNGISFVTMLLDRFRAVSYATHSDIPVETKIATLQGLVDRYNGLESDEDRELVLQKLLEKRPTDGYARSQATTDALAEALTEVEEEQAVLLERVNASQLRITEANQAEYTIGELLVEEFGLTATGDRLTEIISIFWFDNYHYQNKFTFASIGAVKTALNAAVAEHDKIVATFQGTGGYPTNAEAVESFLSSALRLAKTSAGYNPDTWLAQEIEELAKFSDSVTAGETGATIDEPLKTAVNNIENDTTIDTLAEFFAAFQAALAQ